MRRPPLLLLALLALVVAVPACGDDDGSVQDDDETFDSPDDSGDLPEQVAVFGPDEVETDVYGEEVTWTPTADDVAEVDELLAEHLEAEAATGVEPLEAYVRQYVGVGEGEDRVTVNALCEGAGIEDWADELILVNDGGACFWQATVDLPTTTVDPFTVNGEA